VSFVNFVGRRSLPEVYGPRPFHNVYGYDPSPNSSVAALQASSSQVRDVDIFRLHGLDGYLLLRYFKFCIVLCLGGCSLLCSVLLSLNATGDGGMSHLDVLTIANVQLGSARLYSHVCCTAVFFGWVMYMVAREKVFYVKLMNTYHVALDHSQNSESRTLLFTDIPRDMLEKSKISQAVGQGSEVEVWLVTDTRALKRSLKYRASSMDKIDTIMQKIHRERHSAEHEKIDVQEGGSRDRLVSKAWPLKWPVSSRSESTRLSIYSADVARLRIREKQDLHQLFCEGEPVDQDNIGGPSRCEAPLFVPCAIVRFRSLRDASVAYHSLHHENLSKMSPRSIGARPRDMLWDNFGMPWWQRLIRQMICRIFVAAMIIFWSFPVALTTAMANIDVVLPRASWWEHTPTVVQTAVRGLLPSLMLSLMMSLPPRIIARLMRFSGCVTLAEVEVGLQRYYFYFRVIQVFLVAALGSTASSILVQIYSNPGSAATILAKRLPSASNFYLSYIVVQGLTESAFVLLNIEGLFSRYLLSKVFDDTPRKRRRRQARRFEVSAGTVLATGSSLLVVALCYAPLAPLMLCFAACAFAMFYLAYRYNLLMTTDLVADTAGALYESTLQNTLVGLYIGQLCLIGILTVTSVGDRKVGGPLILSCAVLACTIIYQKLLHGMFRTMEDRLLHRSERRSTPLRDLEHNQDLSSRASDSVCGRARRLFMDDFVLVREIIEEQYTRPLDERAQAPAYVAPDIVRREEAVELMTRIESDIPCGMDVDLREVFRVIAGGNEHVCCCSSTGKVKMLSVTL
jgi:hypothetical protein